MLLPINFIRKNRLTNLHIPQSPFFAFLVPYFNENEKNLFSPQFSIDLQQQFQLKKCRIYLLYLDVMSYFLLWHFVCQLLFVLLKTNV